MTASTMAAREIEWNRSESAETRRLAAQEAALRPMDKLFDYSPAPAHYTQKPGIRAITLTLTGTSQSVVVTYDIATQTWDIGESTFAVLDKSAFIESAQRRVARNAAQKGQVN